MARQGLQLPLAAGQLGMSRPSAARLPKAACRLLPSCLLTQDDCASLLTRCAPGWNVLKARVVHTTSHGDLEAAEEATFLGTNGAAPVTMSK